MDTILGSQPIQAIRVFRLNYQTLELESIATTREVWLPYEIKQSSCYHAKAHGFIKPEENCTCGIWACKSRKSLVRTFPVRHIQDFVISFLGYREHYVSAQVEMWGKVIEHDFGYRAEFCRIIPDTIQWYPRQPKPYKKKLIKFLRQKYLGN